MNDDDAARRVILALRAFRDQIDQLLALLQERTTLNRDEVQRARELLTALKGRLREAAKLGVVDGRGRAPTAIERAYYAPTLQKAAANLAARVNTHPINSNWFSSLYGVRIDITHPLAQLEAQFPAASASSLAPDCPPK